MARMLYLDNTNEDKREENFFNVNDFHCFIFIVTSQLLNNVYHYNIMYVSESETMLNNA